MSLRIFSIVLVIWRGIMRILGHGRVSFILNNACRAISIGMILIDKIIRTDFSLRLFVVHNFHFIEVWLHICIDILSELFITILLEIWCLWGLSMDSPWEHELFLKLINLLHLQKALLVGLLQLFHTVGVLESIQSVLTAWRVRRYVSYHYCSAITSKGVF